MKKKYKIVPMLIEPEYETPHTGYMLKSKRLFWWENVIYSKSIEKLRGLVDHLNSQEIYLPDNEK